MARPSRGVSERFLGIRVPDEFFRILKQKAEETDKPISEVVRDVIGPYVYPELLDEHTLQDIGGVNALDELHRYEQLLVGLSNTHREIVDILNDRIEAVRRCSSTAEDFVEREKQKLLTGEG